MASLQCSIVYDWVVSERKDRFLLHHCWHGCYPKSRPFLILIGQWEWSGIDELGSVPKGELFLTESAQNAVERSCTLRVSFALGKLSAVNTELHRIRIHRPSAHWMSCPGQMICMPSYQFHSTEVTWKCNSTLYHMCRFGICGMTFLHTCRCRDRFDPEHSLCLFVSICHPKPYSFGIKLESNQF